MKSIPRHGRSIVAALCKRHAPSSKTKEPEAPSTWRGHLARSLYITCILTLPAQAQLDTSGNGMSDIWERHFNNGELFDPENPAHQAHADPDGDGWTNLIESFAGTNPFDNKPPEGIVPAYVVHLKDQEEAASPSYPEGRLIDLAIISWDTIPGKKYTLTHSADLTANSWVAADVPHYGEGDPIAVTITLNQTGGIAPERFFWRVAIEDTDTDGEGLADYEEYLLGTNPFAADTSGDGIPDFWLAIHGLNPTQHHAGILFPGHEITAVDAYALGVQAHPDATPDDLDGDGLANLIDAHPEDCQINWQRANVTGYVLLDLGWPSAGPSSYLGSIMDFNDHGHVLLDEWVWLNGHWQALEDEPVEGEADWWGMNYNYQSDYNIGWRLTPDGGIIQLGEWSASGGPSDLENMLHTGFMPYDPVTGMYGNFISTLSTFGPFVHDRETSISPIGGDTNGRMIVRKSWHDIEHEICILDQGLEQIGTLEIHPELRPSLSNGIVTPSGWAAVSATATSQSHSHQTLVWKPDGSSISAIGGPIPFHFTGFSEIQGQTIAISHGYHGNGQVSLLDESGGAFGSSQHFADKRIHTFAGNGTAVTSDHKIWLNGELIPLVELCPAYQDLLEDDWNLYPFHGNKHGMFLMRGETDNYHTALILVPLDILSRDKFVTGSFRIPEGMDDLELEFIHTETGENLGQYGDLLGGGATRVYENDQNILSDSDTISESELKPVWFVRSATDPREIEFHMCFADTGTIEIRIHNGNYQIGSCQHELTQSDDFEEIINRISDWITGASFVSGEPPVSVMTVLNEGQIDSKHPLVAACTAPFFNILAEVEGMSILAQGLMDGIVAGINDDWQFVKFIVEGSVYANQLPGMLMSAELSLWMNDPLYRGKQLISALKQICDDWILEPMKNLREDLSSWQGFKDRAWKAWQFLKQTNQDLEAIKVIGYNVLVTTIRGMLVEWGNDFCARMLVGAEKAAWVNYPWANEGLLLQSTNYGKMATYTFGYSFGYVAEQIFIGVLTGGGSKIGQILKQGAPIAGNIALRTAGICAARMHWVKSALKDLGLLDDAIELAYSNGMRASGMQPVNHAIKETPVEVIQQTIARETFDGAEFNARIIMDAVTKSGSNLRKLASIPGGYELMQKRFAELIRLLDDKATAQAAKGWLEAYERLVKFEGDDFVGDRADDFFALMKIQTPAGKEATRKSLEDYAIAVADNPDAKLWLKKLDTIYDNLYRYDSFIPNGGWVNFNGILPARPQGWYSSFDFYDNKFIATDRLLLPLESSAPKYRFEFEVSNVRDNVRAPRGLQDEDGIFEPLTRDVPENFNGGGTSITGDGTQVILENANPVKRVVDMDTGLQVWPLP